MWPDPGAITDAPSLAPNAEEGDKWKQNAIVECTPDTRLDPKSLKLAWAPQWLGRTCHDKYTNREGNIVPLICHEQFANDPNAVVDTYRARCEDDEGNNKTDWFSGPI